ncbi:MAG: phage holin family protein [Nitrospirae bacterium]|nr:phage holin family protein [Magnetococcales bacterium]HAT49487.1 hypothetical protein [Alphaproteobacteria bacterium]
MGERREVLERIVGVASQVRLGWDPQDRPLVELKIDERDVHIEFFFVRANGSEIADGDTIVAAGIFHDGIFRAMAYYNVTQGNSKTEKIAKYLTLIGFLGFGFALLSLVALVTGVTAAVGITSNLAVAIVAVIFLFGSIIFFLRGRQMAKAIALVKTFQIESN